MKNYRLAIIGLGYVGTAIKTFFESHNVELLTYDIDQRKNPSEESIHTLVSKNPTFIYIAVPTPMKKDGSCSLNNLEFVLNEINEVGFNTGCIIIKSTIPPKSTENFQLSYPNLKIIFNPEFLTEANFYDDFRNQKFIILGGNNEDCRVVSDFYKLFFPNSEIYISSSPEAEMIKYFLNCFLAVKVSYANEIYQLCSKLDINFNKIINMAMLDSRIGKTHLQVPGPDGEYGYGGSCFPKDISALIKIFEENNVPANVIKSSWERNQNLDRTKKDWETLKGRAIE